MARRNYPGSFEKRGNTFRWRVCVGGRRYRETFHTTNRKEAEKIARERYRALSEQVERKRDGLRTGVTVAELFAEFERDMLPTLSDGTQRAYRDTLKALRLFWVGDAGNLTVDKVRAGHIRAYMTWRRTHRIGGGGVGNRTIAKDRAVLHRVFAHADQMEYRDGNPVARTDTPKYDDRDPVILTDDEYERLLKACENRLTLRLYVLALGETGARCESEILWIQWDDVDLDGGFIKVVTGRNGHRTKGGKSRWVPINAQLRQALREHSLRYRAAKYDGQPSPWVFHHTKTRRHHKAGERIRSLYHGFKTAAKRAKLPPEFVQHDLRHRRITKWLAEQKSAVLVKEAVGHADLRTTMAYTHLAREHLRGLVDDVPHREELRDRA